MALSDYDPVIEEAAKSWNLDPDLLRSVILQESGGKPTATSSKGAYGLTGLMPQTAATIGVTNLKDPVQQIYGGARYLSEALDAEKGSVPQALLYYHGGPGWRQQYGPESAGYVPGVATQYAKVTKATGATPQAPASDGVPSDDDFLNHVAPKGAAAQPAASGVPSDDDFLKSVGAAPGAPVQGELPTQTIHPSAPTTEGPTPPSAPPQAAVPQPNGVTTPNDILGADRDEYGNPLHPLVAPQGAGVSDLASAVAQGAKEGFGSGPVGLGAPATEALQRSGIYPPAGQTGNPLQFFNQSLINPLAAGADLAMRSGGAVLRGAQAGITKLGDSLPQGSAFTANSATPFGRYIDESLSSLVNPQLAARDLAAAPEAFPAGVNPGGAGGTVSPQAPGLVAANPLQAWSGPPGVARDYLSPEFRANPGVTEPQVVPNIGPSSLNNPLIDETRGGGTPLAAPMPEPAGQPKSAGAAGTPSNVSNIPPKLEQAYRSVAEQQKLNESQPAGVPDYNAYVPGVEPTKAELEQKANVSREQKMLESQIPEEFKTISSENNEKRKIYAEDNVPSAPQIENMKAEREADRVADTNAAWGNKKPADTTPLTDQVAAVLNGPDGKIRSVKSAMNQLMDGLKNDDGTIENDPQRLYGVRRDLANDYSKSAVSLDPTKAAGSHALADVLPTIDAVIEKAAPGYRQYMDNYAAHSAKIDAAQVLNDHMNGLYDSQGRMQLSRVQKMMKDITESRAAPGPNAYKGIPDETMQAFWNLRDDLRRVASKDELARAKGSDTAQNAMDIVKDLAKEGAGKLAQGAAHLGAATVSPGYGNVAVHWGNSLLNNMLSSRAQKKLQGRASEMARPNVPLNPLQSP